MRTSGEEEAGSVRGKERRRPRHQVDVRTTVACEEALDEVVRWRREQLLDSGFSTPVAARLADDPRYDLHALIELVERGCPQPLAARIVSPLEDEVAA